MAAHTNAERSLLTQTRILQAARVLVKSQSWEETKIKEICAEAGVSIGAFYHHFSSKQELMNRAFLLFDETLVESLPGQAGTPLEAVKEVLLAQTAFVVSEAGPIITEYYKNILMDKTRSAVNPERAYYQRVLLCVSNARSDFRVDLEPGYIAELLIKFVRGCLIDWCLHDCGYDVVERTSMELDFLLRGLERRT